MNCRSLVMAACCTAVVLGLVGCGGGETTVRPSVKRGSGQEETNGAAKQPAKEAEKPPQGK